MTLAMMGGCVLVAPVFAMGNQQGGGDNSVQGQVPVVVGTVSAISGTTITVIGKQVPGNATVNTVFTVNAANVKFLRDNIVAVLSNIAVGDAVTVRGTIAGTNVVATTIRDNTIDQGEKDSERMMPNMVGKVSVINGNILTVISKQGFDKNTPNATVTFTVDVTNAKLLRGDTAITLSDIAVGDNVIVQGTITGTNVVATMIRDGKVGNGNEGDNNQALLQIQGNGQPIVAGTVSAINSSTITIANSSNVIYAIDAANAKIIQGKNIISLSGVKIGDAVIVQGVVNGASVTASTIIDTNAAAGQSIHLGFFALIGRFFARLFGF